MSWMNEYEIDNAFDRLGHLPNLGAAVRTLHNLRVWVNRNSDGWPYWNPPAKAAAKLMDLIQQAGRFDPSDCTLAEYRAAVRSLKAFRTKANTGQHWGTRAPNTCDFEIEDPEASPVPYQVTFTRTVYGTVLVNASNAHEAHRYALELDLTDGDIDWDNDGSDHIVLTDIKPITKEGAA